MKHILILSIIFLLLTTCENVSKRKANNYDFPNPVDTKSREIEQQSKKTYKINGIYASNEFPGARLNGFSIINDTLFAADIKPENEPVNHSPWYSFKLWSLRDTTIYIKLNYHVHFHRYPPKISRNGIKWTLLDSSSQFTPLDSVNRILKLQLNSDTLWVSAQELHTSKDVSEWMQINAEKFSYAHFNKVGRSAGGRDLLMLDIYKETPKNKPTIVIFSRQHPPEVTGYLAMKSFVKTILLDNSEFLDHFRIMVFPLLNPDGVDLGHFRHNLGGIDLNRDWAYYRQPETRQIADYIVRESYKQSNNIILGLDFHSTWEDVYYTFDESVQSKLHWFTPLWLEGIEKRIRDIKPEYELNEQPSGLGSPVSKGWFFTQFEAESITYEIGDRTERKFIEFKGRVSAEIMIELLLQKFNLEDNSN